MSKVDFKHELNELSVNLKWANTLVELMRISMNDKNSCTINILLKETKLQKDTVNAFCIKIEQILNDRSGHEGDSFEEYLDIDFGESDIVDSLRRDTSSTPANKQSDQKDKVYEDEMRILPDNGNYFQLFLSFVKIFIFSNNI